MKEENYKLTFRYVFLIKGNTLLRLFYFSIGSLDSNRNKVALQLLNGSVHPLKYCVI